MLNRKEIDTLLSEFCGKEGYCIPPKAEEHIYDNPPKTPEAFVKAVVNAEGFGKDRKIEVRRFRSLLGRAIEIYESAEDREFTERVAEGYFTG